MNNDKCSGSTSCSGKFFPGEEALFAGRNRAQHRVDELSAMAVKAGDVLKHILIELKNAKKEADGINESRGVSPVGFGNFDTAMNYLGGLFPDKPKGPCAGLCPKGNAGASGCADFTDSPLVQFLFKASKYAIDPGEMEAERIPFLDGDDFMTVRFTCRACRKSADGDVSWRIVESFLCPFFVDFDKTVAEFDYHVGALQGIRFFTKEEAKARQNARRFAVDLYNQTLPVVEKYVKSGGKGPASLRKDFEDAVRKVGKSCGSACSGKCKGKCSGACHLSKFVKTSKELHQFKEWLLNVSSFRIPRNRLQVHPVKVDTKNRRYVYELKCFAKDYTKSGSLEYESAFLRVKTKGDVEEMVAKRFDKAVSGLESVKFEKKG